MKGAVNWMLVGIIFSVSIYILVFCTTAFSGETSGEAFYKHLSSLANSGNNSLIEKLNTIPRELDWNEAKESKFK